MLAGLGIVNISVNGTGSTSSSTTTTNTTSTSTLSTSSSGAPIATDQSVTTNKNTPVNITLAGSDLS